MKQSKLKDHIVDMLDVDLPDHLQYHNLEHTMDVYDACISLALYENVEQVDIALLKAASLLHDTGFTKTYNGHEEVSCEIARETLPYFEYSAGQIEIICGIIMATKIPQSPKTHLEEIICDADLDYLGRDDFYTVGRGLYHEFKEQGIVSSEKEWNELQLGFLSNHQYFTETSRRVREPVKQKHLEEIRKLVNA